MTDYNRNPTGKGGFGDRPEDIRPGPGRPPKSVEDRILQEFARQLDDETLARVVAACIKRAEGGDTKALRLALEYLIGTPVQRTRGAVNEDLIELMKNWREKAKAAEG